MKILVDTSVWSLVLRRAGATSSPEADELRNLVEDGRACLMGAIRQELLSGVRDGAQSKKLEKHLAAFPDLPPWPEDYVTAARFSNACRSRGVQGSNTDFLICAVAARNRLAIFTTDGDFVLFKPHLPVVLHEL